MPRRLIIVLLSFAAIMLVGVVAADFVLTRGKDSAPVRTSGKADIGGAFTLTDHTGKRVSEQDFRGRHMLVYFGYTYCPDICPGELQVMTSALDILDEDTAKKVQPVFITIDPERDTVTAMKSYVSNFHESFVGLTGSEDDIAAAAKAYRVYYKKGEEGADDDTYLMEHSSIIYVMGPDGGFIRHFNFGTRPEDIAAELDKILS